MNQKSKQEMNNVARQYREKQILNASPAEQIVMLYDGAIRFLRQAQKAIEEGNIQERYNNNKRAGDILAYLLSTLDAEKGGEIAGNLERLYNYMLQRLMMVDMKNDPQAAEEVINRLRELRESWVKIARGEATPADENKEENDGAPKSALA